MHLILTLILLLEPAYAAMTIGGGTSFQPYVVGASPGAFLVKGDYTDFRVLDNERKNVAYWMIKRGDLKIEQRFNKGKLTEFRITQYVGFTVKEITYLVLQNQMKLKAAVRRRAMQMAYSLFKTDTVDICKMHEELVTQVQSLSKDMNSMICSANLEEKIIDPICKTILPAEEYETIRSAYVSNLRMSDKNIISACLKDFKIQNIIAQAYGISDQGLLRTQLEIIEFKLKLTAANFYNPSPLMEKMITCSRDVGPPAVTDERGKTTFFWSKGSKAEPRTPDEDKQIVGHEIFHSLGLTNEITTKNLVGLCLANATKIDPVKTAIVKHDNVVKAAHIVKKGETGAIRFDDAQIASRELVDGTPGVKITNEDASKVVPQTLATETIAVPSEDLAKAVLESSSAANTASPNGFSPQYAEYVIKQGAKSIGVGQTLVNLIGSSIPSANATTLPKVTLRSPASTFDDAAPGSLKAPIAVVRGPASTGQTSAIKFAPNDISGSDLQATQSGIAAQKRKLVSGSNSKGSTLVADAPSELPVHSVSRMATPFGTKLSDHEGSSTIGHDKTRSRTTEQIKLAKIIESSGYKENQRRLESDSFLLKLKANGITILKLDGSEPIGAPKGDIIYLDKETEQKFVRQK